MGQMQNGAVCAKDVVAMWAKHVTIHWAFPALRDFDSSEQPVMWPLGTSRSEFWGCSHHHPECVPQGVSCFLSCEFPC